MSPGPSFVMVARIAVASSRSDGLAAAIGMGLGASGFSIAALLGLHALFALVPWIFTALKIVGGLYLLYLGYRIWRGADSPLTLDAGDHTPVLRTWRRSFLFGLGTQLSNPKTAMVYTSIFATLLPHDVPASLMLILPLVVFCIEAGWYAVVACALSARSPRNTYLRYKVWVDRGAGGVMGLLGLRLVAQSNEL